MSSKKPVRCVETGVVFDSLTAAGWFIGSYPRKGADNHGVLHSHVSHAANGHGGSKTAGGFHWEFIHKESGVYSILPQKKKEEKLPKIYKFLQTKAPKPPKIDYPPEGYVYIFRNRWHPENVYKIGSTDNLESRRSAARTWGPYECVHYLEVSDCKTVESRAHESLESFRVLGDDLGEEHFEVDLDVAITAVEDAHLVDLRKAVDSLPRIPDLIAA